MRIKDVRIRNYRAIQDVQLQLDDVTVLIGENGVGKSSILSALDWFFHSGTLELDDVTSGQEDEAVRVEATFADISDADRKALGRYASSQVATFQRSWHRETGEKLTGHARAYETFERIRSIEAARELRTEYEKLRTSQPDLDLPTVRSKDTALAALAEWEKNHPDRLVDASVSATHMFGWAGTAKLAGCFGYTFVTAGEDAPSETVDSRGTLLAQLIERVSSPAELENEIDRLRSDFENKLDTVLTERYEPMLRAVGRSVSSALQQHVRGADLTLAVRCPDVRIPNRTIVLRASDGDHETDVARQGQGFQRALLIAVLQELAGVSQPEKTSSLLVAIEEPELYQHPSQARHFANVLKELARDKNQRLQVIYATHSPYFVDSGAFESIRRISKTRTDRDMRTTKCATSSPSQITTDLHEAGLDDASYTQKARSTLRRSLTEAVFARAVLLVEGPTDAALFRGIAMNYGGLDSLGITCTAIGGKQELPVAFAVLRSLEIPTLVVFDADGSQRHHLEPDSGSTSDQKSDAERTRDLNRILLRLASDDVDDSSDWPSDQILSSYACFEDCLETYLKNFWPNFVSFVADQKAILGMKSSKSPDLYELAAMTLDDVPGLLARIIERLIALAGNDH